MNTYFYVQAIGAGELVTQLGPYFSFDHAADVMINHLHDFTKGSWYGLAQIAEFTMIDNKEELINVKIIEQRGN